MKTRYKILLSDVLGSVVKPALVEIKDYEVEPCGALTLYGYGDSKEGSIAAGRWASILEVDSEGNDIACSVN